MFNRLFLFFARHDESRRHCENSIFEKHRFFRDHRERDQSDNRKNRLKHHFERERDTQLSIKARSFAHHARRQMNFQLKSSF